MTFPWDEGDVEPDNRTFDECMADDANEMTERFQRQDMTDEELAAMRVVRAAEMILEEENWTGSPEEIQERDGL